MRVTHEQRMHFPCDAIVSQDGTPNYLKITHKGKTLMHMTASGNWGFHLEHSSTHLVVVVKYWEC